MKQYKGGKGKTFAIRNEAIVLLRKFNSKRFSFGILGHIFRIDKTTVAEIYRRDNRKYPKGVIHS